MSSNEFYALLVVFSGLSIAQLVLYVLDKRGLVQLAEKAIEGVLPTLDKALVPYGPRLSRVYDAATLIESLIDEDTDVLSKVLPAGLRQQLIAKLDQVEALTDGKPEAVPLAEREVASDHDSSGGGQGASADAAES